MTITGTTLFKVNIIATDQNNNTNTQDILFYLKP
jgi:hypothetical protein